MTRLLTLMALFTLSTLAAEIAGTWKATAEGPNGTMERTFVFKVEGNTLSGETVSSFVGKSTITNGRVDGDNLSFTITVNFGGTEAKVNYKGKVTGQEIRLTAEIEGSDQTIEWKGKKIS
jgi:hypothetical protein